MPTYAYACTACGHRFEVQQSFSDASLTECPECAGRLRKLFNSVGIVFKGSGFYRTDSRGSAPSEGGSGAKDGAKESAPATAGTSSTGTSTGKDTAAASTGSSGSSSAGSSSSSGSAGSSSGSAAKPSTSAA